MKTRNDFVSNSSSCSFIFPSFDLKKALNIIRNNDCKYPEFAKYISYYDGFVFDKNSSIVTEFIDYLKKNYSSYICFDNDEYNNRKEFIEKHLKIFDAVEKEYDTVTYKNKDYSKDSDDLIEAIKKDFVFIDTTEFYSIFINTLDEYSFIEFCKSLWNDDFNSLFSHLVCCYSYKRSDSEQPPELEVFIDHNIDKIKRDKLT